MQIRRSDRMNDVKYDLRGPISQEAERMERSGIEIIKLNTGNPAEFGFETPEPVLRALREQAHMAAAYSTSKGIWDAREAVAEYCERRGIPGVSPEHVYTGNGVSEMIMVSLQALLNPGDEVLVPCPDYPLWTGSVNMCGGRAMHYLCDEQRDWQPNLEHMRSLISPRTRAIVIINPNNPTGAVYPRETLEQIVQMAREHELLLLSDEIYDRLLMDGEQHIPTASLAPDLPVITYNGLSKSHQICGYRCGWMSVGGNLSGMQDYLDGLITLCSMRLCSNVLAQAAIRPALEDSSGIDAYIAPGGRLHTQRSIAHEMLNEIDGVSAVKSRAGLYMFPKLDGELLGIHDDAQFVLDFLRAEHVLLTHGSSYLWPKRDHFRIVYLPPEQQLIDVMGRLKRFLSSYDQRKSMAI
ncbi:pyridoxal phosphate-dependent aminotransferase [Eubacteriales bacterium OttesenSCG-928-N13]|nr:pyridoxal phosphate-dependent aminotransferase [Eubacteriales bacterium OttesenSCG-928-N13]